MNLKPILAAGLLAAATITPTQATADTRPIETPAVFEGRTINLVHDWGDARACHMDLDETRCYRTEAEMDTAEAKRRADTERESATMMACSTNTRLYSGTSYTGTVLSTGIQGDYINLASYGFNNLTSSYRIGACHTYMFDGANGGAPAYPGTTSPWTNASSMVSGWNNRISSIYISG